MKSCQEFEEYMAEALFRDLADAQRSELEEHLERCSACAEEFQTLQATMQTMKSRKQPQADPAFMNGLWGRLSPKLNRETRWQKLRDVMGSLWQPRLAIPVTAAICLVLGIWIGKNGRIPTSTPTAKIASESGTSAFTTVENRTWRMLDRSQRMLLTIVNFDPETEETDILNLPHQRILAADLITEANHLKPILSESRNKRLETLVGELETILLQIANLDDENSPENVEIIRTGMQSVLFKIQLTEIENDSQEPTTSITPKI